MKEYVMGNAAIALGALKAGVNIACGYPGTPSSEIIETLSKYPHEGLHLEWSVNEKAALEVAAAAAYSGARALVTMKQVGLNVASDPLMSLAYVGVEGGLVVVSADDPGPISSQTEQDTRRFADFARIPVFDPSSPEEAFEMIQDAFEYSEKYKTPVLFRPTTRIDHGYASIDAPDSYIPKSFEGFKGLLPAKDYHAPTKTKIKGKAAKYKTQDGQQITLDSNWQAAADNMWMCGEEAFISIASIPQYFEDQALNDLFVLRRILESTGGSYTDIEGAEFTFDVKKYTIKILTRASQPENKRIVYVFKQITTNPKKELNSYLSLAAWEDSYLEKSSYYTKLLKTFKE